MIVGAGKSQICRQAGDPGKIGCCSSSPKATTSWQNSVFLGGDDRFSHRVFNCLDEAHAHYGDKCALLRVSRVTCNLIWDTPAQQHLDWFMIKYLLHGLAKWTHHINHHSVLCVIGRQCVRRGVSSERVVGRVRESVHADMRHSSQASCPPSRAVGQDWSRSTPAFCEPRKNVRCA